MSSPKSVATYDHCSDEYNRAFKIFLAHTDQKDVARRNIDGVIRGLSSRNLFIDAGAGNGTLTSTFVARFQHTLAIEPSAELRRELQQECCQAEIVAGEILDIRPTKTADFVLCSHVLYYIDRELWMANFQHLVSCLAPGGILLVLLQNSRSDCMEMLHEFYGVSYDLDDFRNELRAELARNLDVSMYTTPSHVVAETFEEACIVAEFMLNLIRTTHPTTRHRLERYVADRFAVHGGYQFSCSQDFLLVRRTDTFREQSTNGQQSTDN